MKRDFATGSIRSASRLGGPGSFEQGAAFLLPFLGAIFQTRGDALFRNDGATLAALEGPTGLSGLISARLGQLMLGLPLGDHSFRSALVGAFFCALGGLSALHLSYFLFRRQGGSSRLDPWLALGASLAVAFSLPWLEEATITGGASLGAGLALFLVSRLLIGGVPRTLPGALLAGAGLGALSAESPWCGLLLLLSLLVIWPEAARLRELQPLRVFSTGAWRQKVDSHLLKVVALLTATAIAWGAFAAPQLLTSSISLLEFGNESSSIESSWPLHSAIPWMSSIGFLWCIGAIVATLFGLPKRRPIYALLTIIAFDLLAPGGSIAGWTETLTVDTSRKSLYLLALGVTAPLGALGLRTLGETAHALKVFAARPLATMIAVITMAGCFASAEDSLRTLSRSSSRGAQAWTDEALLELPHRALVLTTSATWGRRLLAAQSLGERPDLLVVPLNEISAGSRLGYWLQEEPALEHLLRDFNISDAPSERAITRLVDQRPVFVEANADWDPRLLEHLVPGAPLLRFSSHALARSDRIAALESVPGPQARILAACEEDLSGDAATRSVLNAGLDRLALSFDVVRDRKAGARLAALRPQVSPAIEDEDEFSALATLKP